MSDDKTIIAEPGNLTILNPPSRKNACLVQYSGAKLGKRYPITDVSTIVGRSPSANIVISEASVSRQHAKFVQKENKVRIEDMGSANGSYVNDAKIDGPTELRDGDLVRMGTVILKFFAHDNVDSIMHDKIYRMATIDAGTQIFNKQYLTDTLEAEFKFSTTYDRELSIIIYDLDHFKAVNDTYGHNAGDIILKDSAAIVKAVVRKEDILGRFGGEEFVVILPNTNSTTAAELAERIRMTHETHPFTFEVEEGGTKKPVTHKQTISLGVAQLKSNITSPTDLLEAADKRLYHSKQNGRNKVTV